MTTRISNTTIQKPLTKRQNEILDYIKKYIAKNGYSPSIREIGQGNNISSSATVHAHLTNLIEKGWIKKSDYKFRTIEIIGENEYYNENNGIFNIPIINDTSDFDKEINNPKNKINLSSKLLSLDKTCFLINVSNQVDYKKNDLLLIKKYDKYSTDEEIVVVENNCIKITKYNNQKDIKGKVIYLIRKY